MHSPQGAHNPLRFSRALLPSSFACKERGKKQFSFRLRKRLLSCAMARLILPLPLHLNQWRCFLKRYNDKPLNVLQ